VTSREPGFLHDRRGCAYSFNTFAKSN